jgi:hypothetical protein
MTGYRASHTWALALLTFACGRSPKVDQSRNQAAVIFEPGTYQVEICRSSCPERSLVRGYLVLLDQVLSPVDFPDSLRRHVSFNFERYYGISNACFSLVQRSKAVDTYAGLDPIALTHWAGPDSTTQAVSLYRSADAGYVARLHATEGGFLGEGHSWGFGYDRSGGPAEMIIGRRLGSPEPERCFRHWPF